MSLALGIDDFATIIENQIGYVDKTLLIKDFIDDKDKRNPGFEAGTGFEGGPRQRQGTAGGASGVCGDVQPAFRKNVWRKTSSLGRKFKGISVKIIPCEC